MVYIGGFLSSIKKTLAMLFFLPLLIFDFEPCQFSALLTTTLSVWLSIDYGPTEQSREFYFLHTCTHECRHESVHVSGAAQSQSHHSCWLLTQLPQPSGWDKNRPTFSRSIAEYTDPPPPPKKMHMDYISSKKCLLLSSFMKFQYLFKQP